MPTHILSEGLHLTEWLEIHEDWAYFVNPNSFRMPKVKNGAPIGSLVLVKSPVTDDSGRTFTSTAYGLAASDGLKMMSKREASNVLAKQMVKYMKDTSQWPPFSEIKKVNNSGNVDVLYKPTQYDSFILTLTSELAGPNPKQFLDSLKESAEEEHKEEELKWVIETAKSGRATCRTCNLPIDKGHLRVGEPSMFQEHVTYRWHHLECVKNGIGNRSVDSFEGLDKLSDEEKEAMRKALG